MRKLHRICLPHALLSVLRQGVARLSLSRFNARPVLSLTPRRAVNNSEPAYTGPTYTGTLQTYASNGAGNVNGAIKCQQISGGDGFAPWAMAPRPICLPSVLCPDWRTCRKGCPAHSSRTSSYRRSSVGAR